MNVSYDKNAAFIVLPPISGGRLQNRTLLSWLVRSDLSYEAVRRELLARITAELKFSYPDSGLAALRMWGQTGDRPTRWMAAADPIYLEPLLDQLRLHSLPSSTTEAVELRVLIDHLHTTLAGDSPFGFIQLGVFGYLTSTQPIATAAYPAYIIEKQNPDAFLPIGEGTALHRNLVSEIEMALHEHAINVRRIERGESPINSFWLWGGGVAPQQITRSQPPLFADDALLTGYWVSGRGVAEPWPGSINDCLQQSVAGFVAELPATDSDFESVETCLLQLRDALCSARLDSVTLLFRDGLRAFVRRSHSRRFWRRRSPLLDTVAAP